MRGRLLKVGAYVLAGFVINIAVAWGCVVAHRHVKFEWNPYYNPHRGDPVAFFVIQRFGTEWVTGCGRPGTLINRYPDKVKTYESTPWWPKEAVTFNLEDNADAMAAGWPLLSFSAWKTTTIEQLSKDEVRYKPVGHMGVPLGILSSNELSVFLPFHPLWRGVIINSCFYAALLRMSIATPRAMRRRVRRRKGLCMKCGYPDGGAVRCPECGEVLLVPPSGARLTRN